MVLFLLGTYFTAPLFDVKIEKAIYTKNEKEYIIEGVASKQDLYKGYDYYNDKNDNTNLQYNYERIVSETSNLPSHWCHWTPCIFWFSGRID